MVFSSALWLTAFPTEKERTPNKTLFHLIYFHSTKAANPPRPANIPPATILTAAPVGELVATGDNVKLGDWVGGTVEAVWIATLVTGAKLVGVITDVVGLMNAVEFLMPPVLATMFVPPFGVTPRLVFLLAVGNPELATTRTEDLEKDLECEECLEKEREEERE